MASTTLYPPTVDSSAAAFVATGDAAYCRLYFSLSRFSSSTSAIKSIHISVIKQSTGQSVVRKVDNAGAGRFRASGIIILNLAPIAVEGAENLYYVDILNEDIMSGESLGWFPGWLYKIQIRLSNVIYSGDLGQSAWLNSNAGNFSEWSTYCTTKAINRPRITVPIMKNFDSDVDQNTSNKDKTYSLSLSTLEFNGSYSNADVSETLYSYSLKLYDSDGKLLEDSDTIYTNQYYTPNQFHYIFKHEFEDGGNYVVRLTYLTVNRYTETYNFAIGISHTQMAETTVNAVTIDNISSIENEDFVKSMKAETTLTKENEEGRIGIKLFANNSNPYNGNICLRRSDSRDGYNTWTDIKIIVCVNKIINDLPIIYDNTVESGVWYKYGVQTIDTNGDRGILNQIRNPILRDFEYSYLVGEGGKQLKLQFNNTMNSYVYNYSESKTDTIGGQYPYITRNGNTKYRTIPINGLISFNMDENRLFVTDKELYATADVQQSYSSRRKQEGITYYDYKREFDFREKVLAFLQDGKPKLFKSATEGNIIVRLMQVTGQPNQTLNRMIYSFTSTGHEIADATMENYAKYGFYEVGTYSTSFETYTTKIGQLDIDFNVGDNIIEKIWEKYDSSNQNIAGSRISVKRVHHLTLEFTDKPLRIYNNADEEVLGNNIIYGSSKITIRADYSRVYVFDENISFTKGSQLVVAGGIDDIYDNNDNIVNTVHITVDFLYEQGEEPYIEKQIDTRTSVKGIGQIYNNYKPGTDLYSELYYKFYYEWEYEFRRLGRVTWTCIEAIPGAVFQIQDAVDDPVSPAKTMYHDINWTGVLNLEGIGSIQELKYVGMRKSDGSIDTTKSCDIIVDYLYYTTEGTYKEE